MEKSRRIKIKRKSKLDVYEKELMEMYNNGLNSVQITNKFNVNRETILNWFKNKNLNFSHIKKKISEDMICSIINMHDKGFSTGKIARNLNIPRESIRYHAKKIGLKFPQRLYTLNYNFFNKIDVAEKGYLLGLYFSDGCISPKRNQVQIGMQDLDVIKKIKNILEYTGPINKRIEYNNHIHYILNISSIQMVKDLTRIGCTERKSLTIKFPHEFIPKELINHFLRGVFDGDGCIHCCKQKNKIKKENRYILSLVGTKDMCDGFKFYLNCGNVNKRDKKNNKNTYSWKVYRKGDIRECLIKMYKDATIYMDRKYVKAMEILACG